MVSNETNTLTSEDYADLLIENISDQNLLQKFKDYKSVSSYAADSLAVLVKAGIVKASDGALNPRENATRADVAFMLYNLYCMR
jgi:hypothetical protein